MLPVRRYRNGKLRNGEPKEDIMISNLKTIQ